MLKLAPSILSADFGHLAEDVKKTVSSAGVDISEIGQVTDSGEPILIKEDSSTEKLVPLKLEMLLLDNICLL